MRAAGTELAAANARALVSDWIAIHGGSISGVAWEPATTAKRIIAWLQHSSVVLQGAEFPFYRAFLKSLAVQIRYLRSMVREMPDGKDRLRARIALAFAALSLPAPASALRSATRNLAEELDRQILPDGGHISRNPLAVMELLADLLPLRHTYANQAEDAAGRTDRRRRPHAAGAALLPPRGRQRSPASTAWARRSTTASPRSCATTTPRARRCCTRRIPATSGSRWAARL